MKRCASASKLAMSPCSLWDRRSGQFDQGALPFVCLVVVNRTLAGEHCQRVLAKLPGENMLFVGDECHRHAAVAANAALPAGARLRLGLSATPDHYIDVAANVRLTDYYGEIGDRYGLREALEDGVLTPYRYHVALVDLTEDETEAYGKLSERIAQQVARALAEADRSTTGGRRPRRPERSRAAHVDLGPGSGCTVRCRIGPSRRSGAGCEGLKCR